MSKKKRGKSGRLDQILADLQKLKTELKAIGRTQADLAAMLGKKAAPKTAAKRKRSKPPAARKAGATPKRPVLVSPSRTAS